MSSSNDNTVLFDDLDEDTKIEIEAEIWNIIFTTDSKYVVDMFKRYISNLSGSKRDFAIFIYSKSIGEILGANNPEIIFNSMNAKYVAHYIDGVEALKKFLKKVYNDQTLMEELDEAIDKTLPKTHTSMMEQRYFF